jgi:hypothetical protein
MVTSMALAGRVVEPQSRLMGAYATNQCRNFIQLSMCETRPGSWLRAIQAYNKTAPLSDHRNGAGHYQRSRTARTVL